MKRIKITSFELKLWGYSCLMGLISILLIPVEDCITYPIHAGWIEILVVTIGCMLGILFKNSSE